MMKRKKNNDLKMEATVWEEQWTAPKLPKAEETGEEGGHKLYEELMRVIDANVRKQSAAHEFEEITLTGEKRWDVVYLKSNPPKSMMIYVKKGSETVAFRKITAEEGWKWSFQLPKYDEDGQVIVYTIVEGAIETSAGTGRWWLWLFIIVFILIFMLRQKSGYREGKVIMFNKKVWINRILVICLVLLILVPVTYASDAENPVSDEMVLVVEETEQSEESETETETEAETKTEAETETEAGTETEAETETETKIETEVETGTGTETKVEAEEGTETETKVETEEGTETETKVEAEEGTETETKVEAEVETETEMKVETEVETETETKVETEVETETETETKVEMAVEIETGEEVPVLGSNKDLLAAMQLVTPPAVDESFRFITIKKNYAIAQKNNINVYTSYTDGDNEALAVAGILQKGNLCCIIKETEENGWLYIESEIVRGFVKEEDLLTGDEADALVYEKGEKSFTFAEASTEAGSSQETEETGIPPLWTPIDREPAIAGGSNVKIYAGYVSGDDDEPAAVRGILKKDSLCYMLAEEEDSEWIYIESGEIRGFVKGKELLIGAEADTLIYEKGEKSFDFAKALVAPINNEALTYTKTTTQKTVIDKVYGIATLMPEDTGRNNNEADAAETIHIYEGKDTQSRVVGELSEDALCYIIADAEEDWIYIESNDVRGFVEKDCLTQGKETEELVAETGEDHFEQATEIIPIEENKACYYTLTSIKEGAGGSAIRASMLTFARQFLGNPYVWGGTSLTNGADCSGFVQSVYAYYGYTLPRIAEDQAGYGMQIPVESALPGDLIFYAKYGYIYHVVMYIGEGKVIHASSSTTGIIISDINTAHAVWATRIIEDGDTPNIQVASAISSVQSYSSAAAADVGEYLGEFKLTAYCACSICCEEWADGITASGTIATEGRTVAMAGVPFGTKLIVNGVIFTVEDRGTPYGHIDIFMNDHNRCLQFGVGTAKVYQAN